MEKIFDVDEDLSYDKVLTIFVTSLYKSWDETLGTKETNKYYYDLPADELDEFAVEDGVLLFFQKVLNLNFSE